MNAGKYRERIRIEQNNGTRSATGHKTENWQLVSARWAAARFIAGAEDASSGIPTARASWAFEVLAPTTVALTHRIVWRSRAYAVQAIDDSRPDIVTIYATEGTHGEN